MIYSESLLKKLKMDLISMKLTFTLLNLDVDYWKFSLDEMALLDVPAMIHYILRITHSSIK